MHTETPVDCLHTFIKAIGGFSHVGRRVAAIENLPNPLAHCTVWLWKQVPSKHLLAVHQIAKEEDYRITIPRLLKLKRYTS